MCLCTTINILLFKAVVLVRFPMRHFHSAGKQRFEESPQASVSDCQGSRQKVSLGASLVVEIVTALPF